MDGYSFVSAEDVTVGTSTGGSYGMFQDDALAGVEGSAAAPLDAYGMFHDATGVAGGNGTGAPGSATNGGGGGGGGDEQSSAYGMFQEASFSGGSGGGGSGGGGGGGASGYGATTLEDYGGFSGEQTDFGLDLGGYGATVFSGGTVGDGLSFGGPGPGPGPAPLPLYDDADWEKREPPSSDPDTLWSQLDLRDLERLEGPEGAEGAEGEDSRTFQSLFEYLRRAAKDNVQGDIQGDIQEVQEEGSTEGRFEEKARLARALCYALSHDDVKPNGEYVNRTQVRVYGLLCVVCLCVCACVCVRVPCACIHACTLCLYLVCVPVLYA